MCFLRKFFHLSQRLCSLSILSESVGESSTLLNSDSTAVGDNSRSLKSDTPASVTTTKRKADLLNWREWEILILLMRVRWGLLTSKYMNDWWVVVLRDDDCSLWCCCHSISFHSMQCAQSVPSNEWSFLSDLRHVHWLVPAVVLFDLINPPCLAICSEIHSQGLKLQLQFLFLLAFAAFPCHPYATVAIDSICLVISRRCRSFRVVVSVSEQAVKKGVKRTAAQQNNINGSSFNELFLFVSCRSTARFGS